jgi:formylmethanofuran dehydrogenase subunit E
LSQSIPKEIIKGAVRFHGHLGPYLLLGVKAGLFANELLGKDPFKTKAIVETKIFQHYSCFVDGIQFTTGCTMGKGNIELRNGVSLSVLFTKNGKKFKLNIKKCIQESLKKIISTQMAEKFGQRYSKKKIDELFIFEDFGKKIG